MSYYFGRSFGERDYPPVPEGSIRIPIENLTYVAKGMMLRRPYRGEQRIRGAEKSRWSSYRKRYIVNTDSWGDSISYNEGELILTGNHLHRIGDSSSYIVLVKAELQKKKRNCRMCVSHCKGRICGLYDPVWKYLPDET